MLKVPVRPKKNSGLARQKSGFRKEDAIKDKFLDWHQDSDAQTWLTLMGYRVDEIESISADKPRDEKADVEITIRSRKRVKTEGISIKLVSKAHGFNQIDKRWLARYVEMWKMPTDVLQALKLFVGETPPTKLGRSKQRMFLDELDPSSQKSVIDFFSQHKSKIISDLFAGRGPHSAGWVMIAYKTSSNAWWTFRDVQDVIRFYADGPVVLTANGNLKIGRITMQRKGGDAGRETARMLQFKIDPSLLFEIR